MDIHRKSISDSLVWFAEHDFGYFPVDLAKAPYNQEYWDRFVGYSRTEQGDNITDARLKFVQKHYTGPLLDVGIGCGAFLAARQSLEGPGSTFGYDINPIGVAWLKERSAWLDPYKSQIQAASFWDVLEHILEPEPLLLNIRGWVFMSAPIFKDLSEVLVSKHFKKDEHCWYWTPGGLEKWMKHYGFGLVDYNRMESDLGRESIGTFAFRRTK